ncbi:MAG: hypothetical protein GY696_23670 [Gammaproteobacteria bacterium]|nr:hypothetical protein [Gammaproteobacteria bacterium]
MFAYFLQTGVLDPGQTRSVGEQGWRGRRTAPVGQPVILDEFDRRQLRGAESGRKELFLGRRQRGWLEKWE